VQRFYLNSTAKITNCPDVIGAVFGKRKNDFISEQELIPLYLNHVKQLIKKSDTTVYITELQLRETIILKVSFSDLSVEFAIGFYFLNSLRSIIPNFMQTYALFSCGNYEDGKICTTTRRQTQFLALERVESDVDIKNYVATSSINDVYLLLLQIILAIRTANRKFGFTHYDLHVGNILLKKVPPTEITYDETSIVVDCIAVIIDYGRSRVQVDKSHYLWWSSGLYSNKNNAIERDIKLVIEDIENYLPSKRYPTNELVLLALRNIGNEGKLTQEIIDFLIANSTKHVAVTTYTPETCKRRKRRTPVTSVLDYFEGYPYSRKRRVDIKRILDEAISTLETAKLDSPTYKTHCKLYVFFYRDKLKSIPPDEKYQQWYERCSSLLGL
jgi:hypothetical protein